MRISFAAAAALLAFAACSASGLDRRQIAGPSARAFAYVVVSVSDMPEALALWETRLGMEVVASRRGPDRGLSRIWGLDDDAIAEQVLLNTPGVIDGGVHLVRFAGADEPVRAGAGQRDLGPRSLVLGVRDIEARASELIGTGVMPKAASNPPGGGGAVRRTLGLQDDVEIVLEPEPRGPLALGRTGYAVALGLLAVVPDVEREAAFFRDVLGLNLLASMPAGEAGADVRILGTRDSRFGRLELVDYAAASGRDLYWRTAPPARGILSVTYVVPDLAPILERGRTVGIADHGPLRTILGEGRMASVTSPAGLRVDFVQL